MIKCVDDFLLLIVDVAVRIGESYFDLVLRGVLLDD